LNFTQQGVVFASPAVSADGSVYVVSNVNYGNNRGGQTTIVRGVFLNKFTASGGFISSTPFPKSTLYPFTDGGVSTAPPNIWHFNGTEVIMVPAIYRGSGKTEVRVIAFSTGGSVIGDKRVSVQDYEITLTNGGILGLILDFADNCIIHAPCNYNPPEGGLPLSEAGWPQPGVAIWEYPQYSPYIWVADAVRNTVAYKFDPAAGFSEIYRFTDAKDRLSSPPTALDNVIAAVGGKPV
jgi:hypothetical protein